MHSIQGKIYRQLNDVPEQFLVAFTSHANLSEKIRIREGKILFWEEHYFHLIAAMRIHRMEIPMEFTMESMQDQLLQLCNANVGDRLFSGVITIRVAKSKVPSSVRPTSETFFWLSIDALSPDFSLEKSSLPIDLYKDHYCLSGLYQNMTSLQTNWSSMAWVYAHENGFSDLVVLNENKHIQGSLMGHLFIVNGTKISTPSVNDGAIKSVYRKKMIDCIKAATDFTIEEVSLTPFVLQRADELFVLENAVALHQITAYRKKQYTQTTTQALFSTFQSSLAN